MSVNRQSTYSTTEAVERSAKRGEKSWGKQQFSACLLQKTRVIYCEMYPTRPALIENRIDRLREPIEGLRLFVSPLYRVNCMAIFYLEVHMEFEKINGRIIPP